MIPVASREGLLHKPLTVAMTNPMDLAVIDSLRFTTSQDIEPAVALVRSKFGRR